MRFLTAIIILLCLSCSRKMTDFVNVNNEKFLSVVNFGAKGNGSSDDRLPIQNAINSGYNLYFPKGKYLLKSRSTKNTMLVIKDNNYPAKILFEEGAILIVSPEQPDDYPKTIVLGILTENRDISSIEIDGITILGNSDKHKILNTGITSYSRPGSQVRKLVIRNATFKDMGGSGIISYATKNYFNNIYTENCGSHGIGFNNIENPGILSYVYMDGHTSINDKAYSIDFSGKKDPENPLFAFPEYKWEGEVKNIYSKGSKFGIKTAGYWNLTLDSVIIEDSESNGFFINIDAPGSIIKASNMTIINSKGNGLNLDKKSHFIGKNIKIENAGLAINVVHASVDIQGLAISTDRQTSRGIRVQKTSPSCTISDFSINGMPRDEEYPIRIKNARTILSKGKIYNNDSKYQILIYEGAGDITLEKLDFYDSRQKSKEVNGVLSLQKAGKTRIIECDFTGVKGKKIKDQHRKIIIEKSKGINE